MTTLRRREVITAGGAAAALAIFQSRFARAFQGKPGEVPLTWLDQPATNPVPNVIQSQLVWEDLDSWITPNEKFFSIAHFDRPQLDGDAWRLEIDGLVKRPLVLSLADL